MKWSFVNVVRNTLLALSIGALLPSIASACSVTPSARPTGDNTSGVRLFIPDARNSLMNSATLLGSIPFGNEQLDIFKISDGHFALAWFDGDGGDSSSSVGSVTSTTPVPGPATDDSTPTATTPEPSSLALLGFGAIALGVAFASRRLRPTPVG
jgi:PEP-CTERM motif